MNNNFLVVLVPKMVSGEMSEEDFFDKCFVSTDLKEFALERIREVKRMLLNTPVEMWGDKPMEYVKYIKATRDDYKFIQLCINRIRKTYKWLDKESEKGTFYNHRVEVTQTDNGYIVTFPDDNAEIVLRGRKSVAEVRHINK